MNDKEIEKKQEELWKKGIGLAVFKKICLDKEVEKANCEECNNPMRLENCDGRDYWICEKCEISFLVNPKENCEHNVESVIFGVNNVAWCEDCGNIIAYE